MVIYNLLVYIFGVAIHWRATNFDEHLRSGCAVPELWPHFETKMTAAGWEARSSQTFFTTIQSSRKFWYTGSPREFTHAWYLATTCPCPVKLARPGRNTIHGAQCFTHSFNRGFDPWLRLENPRYIQLNCNDWFIWNMWMIYELLLVL